MHFRRAPRHGLSEVPMSSVVRLLLWLPIWLSLAAGSACSGLVVTDPASPFYVPPVGSRVVVKQPLTVPPGKTRVFLQYGKVIPRGERDDYAVNCNFEINTLSDSPRTIEVGSYTVSRSLRRSDDIVSREPLRVAAAGRLAGMMIFRRDGGTPVLFEEVVLSLTSTPPTDVRELACRGAMDEATEMMLPTLAEMRQALGAYATIEVPAGGG
jgi:hypothetical protein